MDATQGKGSAGCHKHVNKKSITRQLKGKKEHNVYFAKGGGSMYMMKFRLQEKSEEQTQPS